MYSSLQKTSGFQMDSKDRTKIFECRNSGFARSKSLLNRFDQNLILETEKLHPLKNSDRTSASNFAPARAQSSDIQSDENSSDPSSELNLNPLKNFDQTSELNLAPTRGESPNLQSDENFCDPPSELNLNPLSNEPPQNWNRSPNSQSDESFCDPPKEPGLDRNPLKNFAKKSAFENEISHPLKNSDRTSAVVRIRSLLDRFNKNHISKTENYIRLKISNTKPVMRAKFRADMLLSGYT